jgi:L-asparaginase
LNSNIPELKQFHYELDTISLGEPIDSSDMNPEIWGSIAKTIFDNYANYNGFVVLHGTDTMAFSTSALSFMLQGLRKAVIFTGSQLPIGQIRTDGKENLITAVEIAGMLDANGESIVQEVALYFEDQLYRGNRTCKISTSDFEAFKTYNYPLLAEAGVKINMNKSALYRTTKEELSLETEFNSKIGLVKIFPGMRLEGVKAMFDIQHSEAIILETFGNGNSFESAEFEKIITDYMTEGGIVLNITQCAQGNVVFGLYQTSEQFQRLQVVSGYDLTTEAAVTKMMYVLGKTEQREERIKLLMTDICGEVTAH